MSSNFLLKSGLTDTDVATPSTDLNLPTETPVSDNLLGERALGSEPVSMNAVERAKLGTDYVQGYLSKSLEANKILSNAEQTERSGMQLAGQVVNDVAKGFHGGIGGLLTAGGLGVDALTGGNTNVGGFIAGGVQHGRERFESWDSDKRKAQLPVNEAKYQKISQDNEAKYGDTFVGSLASFKDTLSNLSPEELLQTTGEGVGSLVVPTAVMGTASKLTGGASKIATKEAEIIASKAAPKVDKAVESMFDKSTDLLFGGKKGLATMAIIGGMEGGSNASEVINKVIESSHTDLYQGSKHYRDLIDQGYSELEAKKSLAKTAGTQVLVESGLFAIGTGRLVAGFEAAPMLSKGLNTTVGNMVKEGIEETSQGFVGQLSQNKAVQDYVNEEQKLYENTGTGAALGLVGGVASTGVVGATATTVGTTNSVANKTSQTINAKKEQAKQKRIEKASVPLTTATTVESAIDKSKDLDSVRGKKSYEVLTELGIEANKSYSPEEVEGLKKLIKDPNDEESLESIKAIINIYENSAQDITDPKALKNLLPNKTDEEIKAMVDDGGASPHIALNEAIHTLLNGNLDESTRDNLVMEAYDLIHKEFTPKKNLISKEELDLLNDSELSSMLRAYFDTLNNLDHKAIKGIDGLRDDVIARRAKTNPKEAVDNILYSIGEAIENGNSNDVIKHISKTAEVVKQALENDPEYASKLQSVLDLVNKYVNTEGVSNDLFSRPGSRDGTVDNYISDGSKSVKDFMSNLIKSAKNNDTERMNNSLGEFRDLTQSMINKANAVNDSAQNFKKVKKGKNQAKASEYSYLSKNTRKFDDTNSVTIRLDNQNSVNLGRNIIEDTNELIEAFNTANSLFGDNTSIPMVQPNKRLKSSKGFKPLTERVVKDTPVEVKPTEEVSTNVEEDSDVEISLDNIDTEVNETTVELEEESKSEPKKEVKEESENSEEVEIDLDNLDNSLITEDSSNDSLDGYELDMDAYNEYVNMEDSLNESDYDTNIETESKNTSKKEDFKSERKITFNRMMEKEVDSNMNALNIQEAFGLSDENLYSVDQSTPTPKVNTKKALSNYYRTFGINNAEFINAFRYVNKKGEDVLDHKKLNSFISKFANEFMIFKEAGIFEGSDNITNINLQESSLKASVLVQMFLRSLDSKTRSKLSDTINKVENKRDMPMFRGSLNRRPNKGFTNTFIEGFNVDLSSVSPTLFSANPFMSMANFLVSSLNGDINTIEDSSKRAKRIADITGYLKLTNSLLHQAKKEFNKNISGILDTKKEKGKTLREIITQHKMMADPSQKVPINHFTSYKTLNALTVTKDGELNVNDRLFEGYFMATMDTLMESIHAKRDPLHADQINDLIMTEGVSEDGDITDTSNALVRNIVHKAKRILGENYNKESPDGVNKGSETAFVADLIDSLQGVKIKDAEGNYHALVNKSYITNDKGHKVFKGYKSNVAWLENNSATEVGSNLFTDGADRYFESSVRMVAPKTNDNVLNTVELKSNKSQTKTRNKVSNIPNKYNEANARQVLGADVSALADFLYDGLGDFVDSKNSIGNVYVRESNLSKVNGIKSSIKYIEKLRENFKSYIQDNEGVEPDFFFKFGTGRENRVHAEGANNPNTNKIIREVLSATKSSIDLTSTDGSNKYLAAIGQGFGLTVNNRSREDVANEVRSLLSSDYKATVKAMSERYKANRPVITKDVIKTFKNDIKNSSKKLDTTMVSLMNMFDIVRSMNTPKSELSNYQTWVYLEIDGITKGLGDSIALFNRQWEHITQNTDKTGTVFNSDFENYKNRVLDPNNEDAYRSASSALKHSDKGVKFLRHLNNFKNSVNATTKYGKKIVGYNHTVDPNKLAYKGQLHVLANGSLMRLLEEFDIGMSFSGKDINISRSFSKKPVMVINYGAGAQSVGRKIFSLIQEEYMDRLDKISRKYDKVKVENRSSNEHRLAVLRDFFNDQSLTLGQANRRVGDLGVALQILDKSFINLETFTIDSEGYTTDRNNPYSHSLYQDITVDFKKSLGGKFRDVSEGENIGGVLGTLFGKPMAEAVSSISPNTFDASRKIASVIDLISEGLQRQFSRLVVDKKAEIGKLIKDGEITGRNIGDGLSTNEYMEIITELRNEIGTVDVGSSVHLDFFNMFTDTIDNPNATSVRALTDNNRRVLDSPLVKKMGVSASPLLTIGAEGNMLNIMARIMPKKYFDVMTTIHDGYNSQLGNHGAEIVSLMTNLATLESWKEYDVFKSTVDIAEKFAKHYASNHEEVSGNFLDVINDLTSTPDQAAYMQQMYSEVLADSKLDDTRFQSGVISSGMNGNGIPVIIDANRMSNVPSLMEAIIRANQKGITVDVQKLAMDNTLPLQNIDDFIKEFSTGDFERRILSTEANYNNGLSDSISDPVKPNNSMNNKEVINWISNNLKPNKESKHLFKLSNQMLKSSMLDGMSIDIIDSATAVERGIGKNVNGLYDRDSNLITIVNKGDSNLTIETLTHELLHASLNQFLRSFFFKEPINGISDSYINETVNMIKDAFESFNNEIEKTGIDNLDNRTKQFYDLYVSKYFNNPTNKNEFEMIHEFITWGLTNKPVSEVLKNIKTSKAQKDRLGTALTNLRKAFSKMFMGIYKALGFKGKSEIKNIHDYLMTNVETLLRLNEVSLESSKPVSKNTKVNDWVQNTLFSVGTNESVSEAKKQESLKTYNNILDQIKLKGFNLDAEQSVDFIATAVAIDTANKIDGTMLARSAEILVQAMEEVKESDFYPNSNPTNREIRLAKTKFNFMKRAFTSRDLKGNRLVTLMTMAMVDPQVANILDSKTIKANNIDTSSTDGLLSTVTELAFDAMYDKSFKLNRRDSSALEHIQLLKDNMEVLAARKQSMVDRIDLQAHNYGDVINEKLVNYIDMASKESMKLGKKLNRYNNSFALRSLSAPLNMTGALLSLKGNDAINTFDSVLSYISRDKTPKAFVEFVSDLVGRTGVNANVYDMIKTVKSNIQVLRQQYREVLPKHFKEKFSEELNSEQLKAITDGLVKTDLSSLFTNSNYSSIKNLLSNDSNITTRTQNIVNNIASKETRAISNRIYKKAEQLSTFLVTGEVGNNLLKNPEQIARLQGESLQNSVRNSELTAKEVSELVSLLAFQKLDSGTKSEILNLLESEQEGIKYVTGFINGLSKSDIASNSIESVGHANYMKGYVPFTQTSNYTIIEADNSRDLELTKMGYKFVETIPGTDKSYYSIDVKTTGAYHLGIMQTVKETTHGVDDRTGALTGIPTGEIIRSRKEVDNIFNSQRNNSQQDHTLIPLYEHPYDSKPYAYQRLIPKHILDIYKPETDFSKLISAWAGRKVEEGLAKDTNNALIDNLADMYQKDSNKKAYIDVMDKEVQSKDPVLKDAMSLMPLSMREYIKDKSGEHLYIRRDMLNDVLGYRMALVGDFWTGKNRYSEKFSNTVKSSIEAVMGKNAYRRLMKTQYAVQAITANARDIIVIRSMVVPAMNLASNIGQLAVRQVPLTKIAKGFGSKTKEANIYVDLRSKMIKLEADKLNSNNTQSTREINSKIDVIQNAMKRLSIYPLIESGEFSSVASAEVDRTALQMLDGNTLDYIEGLVDKLPKQVRTLGKYAIISRDTALYKGLEKMTDYGDFIAKSIYYDHLISKGVEPKEAMGRIREEFVNYDKLQGRTRHTVENLGLAWFWNWKLRSTKVMLSIMKENPAYALLWGTLPFAQMGAGIPMDESFLARMFNEKSLTYSLGIGQGLGAWSNLPISSVFN